MKDSMAWHDGKDSMTVPIGAQCFADGTFTSEFCCAGDGGNAACWDGHFMYEPCCLEAPTWGPWLAVALVTVACLHWLGVSLQTTTARTSGEDKSGLVEMSDSLGQLQRFSLRHAATMKTINTIYGIATIILVTRHYPSGRVWLVGLSQLYPKLHAAIVSGLIERSHAIAACVFCAGLQERWRWRFRWGTQDLIMILCIFLWPFMPALMASYCAALTGVKYVELYWKFLPIVQPVSFTIWFLVDLVAARALVVVLHYLKIPFWYQVAVSEGLGLLCHIFVPVFTEVNVNLHPACILRFFTLYLAAAHFEPQISLQLKKHRTWIGRYSIKLGSVFIMGLYACQNVDMSDSCADWQNWLAIEFMKHDPCARSTLNSAFRYVISGPLAMMLGAALLACVYPGNACFEALGKCVFGAYLTHRWFLALLCNDGMIVHGFPLLPRLWKLVAPVAQPPGYPLLFLGILLLYNAGGAWVGGTCCMWILQGLTGAISAMFRVFSFGASHAFSCSAGISTSPKLEKTMAQPAKEGHGNVGTMEEQLYAHEASMQKFETCLDLLPRSVDPAVLAVDGRKPLTYARLVQFANELDLASFGIGLREHDGTAEASDRLCVLIPNGPEAVTCFIAMSQYCTYAPINMKLTQPEIEFEFNDLPAKAAVVQQGEENDRAISVARQTSTPVLEMCIDPEVAGLFTLGWHPSTPSRLPKGVQRNRALKGDIALVVHTSGTTKKPKIVPLTHENITCGSLCVRSTLRLQPDDCSMNIMPLYHMHGLSVSVLASLLAGSRVLATSGFDASCVFDWLSNESNPAPNWYSAVPTMHHLILECAQDIMTRTSTAPPHGLELIRNCSAALPVWVASKLQEVLSVTVMTTYAMSESVPICSNPRNDRRQLRAVSNLSSVGYAAGPMVCVLDQSNSQTATNEEGEVCMRGASVTKGYEWREHMSRENDPNTDAFVTLDADGPWLRTGDKGFVDASGHLTLVGRFKEIVNRGGEKISPLEVEEILQQHPAVHRLMAFAMPHVILGEVVGAVVVIKPQACSFSLPELREYGSTRGLSKIWLPEVLLFADKIPTGPTGKPLRINLAGPNNCHFKIQPLGLVDDESCNEWRVVGQRLVPRENDVKIG